MMRTTAVGPPEACTKGTMAQIMTGKNMSTPLQPGPSRCAAAVTPSTSAAPQAICRGRRSRAAKGCGGGGGPCGAAGSRARMPTGMASAKTTASHGACGKPNTSQPVTKKPASERGKASNQGSPQTASQGYASAVAAQATTPSKVL